jgi:glutamine amidotransferase
MRVTIVDYGSGNLRSAAKAFERQAAVLERSYDIIVTSDPDLVRTADFVVLPGVGAFADCRAGLYGVDGMVAALTEAARGNGRPFLGICVGMQLLAERGIEYGSHEGLGWIAGEVNRIEPGERQLKVPHMGWNQLTMTRPDHPLAAGIGDGDYAYFVHSYAFRLGDDADLLATTGYGNETITAALVQDNIAGTQFHPEKSQQAGLQMISNFLNWRP